MANEFKISNKVIFLNGHPISLPQGTSDPGSASVGDMFYRSDTGYVRLYNGSAWENLTIPSDVSAAVSAEVTARNAAITSAINTEITARNAAITSAVDTEATARDAAISVAVVAEATARDAAIAVETTNRVAADSAEVTARDAAITSAINTEITARNAAIATEATARDAAITSAINTEITARNAAIAVETTNRQAADSAEVTARDAAITSAINTEITARNAAIAVEATARDAAIAVETTNRVAADALKVSKAGDTMSGTLDMGANKITSTYVPSNPADLVNYAALTQAVVTGGHIKEAILVDAQLVSGGSGGISAAAVFHFTHNVSLSASDGDFLTITDGINTETYTFRTSPSTTYEVQIDPGDDEGVNELNLSNKINAVSSYWRSKHVESGLNFYDQSVNVIMDKVPTASSTSRMFGTFTTQSKVHVEQYNGTTEYNTSVSPIQLPTSDPGSVRFGFGRAFAGLTDGEIHVALEDNDQYSWNASSNNWVTVSGGGSVPNATSASGGGTLGKVTADSDKGLVIGSGILAANVDASSIGFVPSGGNKGKLQAIADETTISITGGLHVISGVFATPSDVSNAVSAEATARNAAIAVETTNRVAAVAAEATARDAAIAVETTARTNADLLLLPLDGTRSMTGALNMNSHLINSVTDPSSAQDAATKNYVDASGGTQSSTSGSAQVSLTTRYAVASSTFTGSFKLPDPSTLPHGYSISVVNITAAAINVYLNDGFTLQQSVLSHHRAFFNISVAGVWVSHAWPVNLSGSGDLSIGGLLSNVTDPGNPQDAATKNYVDGSIATEATARSNADALLLPLAGGIMSGNLTMDSSTLLKFKGGTNYVSMNATSPVTGSYTISLPDTAPSPNAFLKFDGSNYIWGFPAGSGSVNSGIAGRLALYPASSDAVDDVYVQNSNNIDVAIASHPTLASARAYTIPDAGANASFVMTAGDQTIAGSKTFSSSILASANYSNDLGSDTEEMKFLWAHALKHADTTNPNLLISTTGYDGNIVLSADGTGTLDILASIRRAQDSSGSTYFVDSYFDALPLAQATSSPTEISSDLSFPLASFDSAILDYRIKEAGTNKVRTGKLMVCTDGTISSASDQFSETDVLGSALALQLDAIIDTGNVVIRFNNTHASHACTMRVQIRKFRA